MLRCTGRCRGHFIWHQRDVWSGYELNDAREFCIIRLSRGRINGKWTGFVSSGVSRIALSLWAQIIYFDECSVFVFLKCQNLFLLLSIGANKLEGESRGDYSKRKKSKKHVAVGKDKDPPSKAPRAEASSSTRRSKDIPVMCRRISVEEEVWKTM